MTFGYSQYIEQYNPPTHNRIFEQCSSFHHNTWGSPGIGVTLDHPFFTGFSTKNQPFGVTPFKRLKGTIQTSMARSRLFSREVTLLSAASEAVDHQEVDTLPSQREWQVTWSLDWSRQLDNITVNHIPKPLLIHVDVPCALCIYIYIYIYIYEICVHCNLVYIYVYIYIYAIYGDIHICVCVRYIYIYICIYIYIHTVYVYIYIYVVCMYVYVCISIERERVYIYTYINSV